MTQICNFYPRPYPCSYPPPRRRAISPFLSLRQRQGANLLLLRFYSIPTRALLPPNLSVSPPGNFSSLLPLMDHRRTLTRELSVSSRLSILLHVRVWSYNRARRAKSLLINFTREGTSEDFYKISSIVNNLAFPFFSRE